MMKTTRHSLMAKGILVLLSLLIMVFVFTYSWYMSQESPATSSGMQIRTDADTLFEVAIGFWNEDTNSYVMTDFSDSIDFEHLVIPSSVAVSNSKNIDNAFHTGESASINLLQHFKPIDLTGNGSVLIRPAMTYKNRSVDYDSPLYATTNIADEGKDLLTENKEYVSFDIYVRSTSTSFSISLADGSYVLSGCEVNNTISDFAATDNTGALLNPASSLTFSTSLVSPDKMVGSTVKRKSNYGDFSEDCVVGAIRMAFTDYYASTAFTADNFFTNAYSAPQSGVNLGSDSLHPNTPALLWIPRSDVYLQDDDEDDDWLLHYSGETEEVLGETVDVFSTRPVSDYDPHDFPLSGLTYSEAAAKHIYYDYTKITNSGAEIAGSSGQYSYASRYTEASSPVTSIASAANTTIMTADLTGLNLGSYTYSYSKCRVNMWIEGCDAEARKAIDGGQFFFGIDLSAN